MELIIPFLQLFCTQASNYLKLKLDHQNDLNISFIGGRTSTFVVTLDANTNWEARIYGTEGSMKILPPFWCSTQLQIKEGEIVDFGPLSERKKTDYNYFNSANMGLEAQHVRECLLKGLTESPVVKHEDSLKFAKILEEVRRQVGVEFD